jgi:hypothetical protein
VCTDSSLAEFMASPFTRFGVLLLCWCAVFFVGRLSGRVDMRIKLLRARQRTEAAAKSLTNPAKVVPRWRGGQSRIEPARPALMNALREQVKYSNEATVRIDRRSRKEGRG